jgi:hypothetical protein
MREPTEEAFWGFVDQKWRDALNIAAAEPSTWGAGTGGKTTFQEAGRREVGGNTAVQDTGRKEATKLAKAGAAIHVTGAKGRRPRQGDGRRVCVFKEVMGCTGSHPPWLCKVFGKLPAKEREKLITDNKLCPFCLLHDKDKPCGAKQRAVSVACTTPGCKGRHAQKLHDFLKDVFREEGRVHVVQEDDEWEESEEAWELGEEEATIVGAVQQEAEYSWQDACDAWAVLDEEAEGGVHQVEAREVSNEVVKGGQCKKASEVERGGESPEGGDLLVEGEEREYFLELLMRGMPWGQPASSDPPKAGAAIPRGKKRRALGKKLRRKLLRRAALEGPRKEGEAEPARGEERQAVLSLAHSPEAKGRGLAGEGPRGGSQLPAPPPISGGECSGP